MKDLLQLSKWKLLNDVRKKELLKSFEGYKGHDFKLKAIETFLTNKVEFTTGIFELDGDEYVFVPGSDIELGWNSIAMQDRYIVDAMEDELKIACEPQEVDAVNYLKKVFTSNRVCHIEPMMVERNVKKVVNETSRLIRYTDVIENIKHHGLSVLTEDEWEYLCGGGTSRIFGEHIDEEVLEDICIKKKDSNSCNFEQLNQFGLYMSYDPYMYEIVDSPCYVKGGDGGGASHGGYNILGILPISPHYRDTDMIETISIDETFEWDVYVRRILRID